MIRRVFLALAVATVLVACAQPIAKSVDTGQFQVRAVNVDLSQFERVKGRNIDVPRAQVERDLSAALTRELTAASAGNSRPVDVDMKIFSVSLVSPGQAALVGGLSNVSGEISVRDARSGEVLVPPTEIAGTPSGYAPGGIIAVALTKSPQEDYQATVAGFAADVRRSLYPEMK